MNGLRTDEPKEKLNGGFPTGRAGGAAPGAPIGAPQLLKIEPRK